MNHLQSSGISGLLAILAGLFVAIAGILIILLSKSRKARFLSLLASGIPVLIGAAGTLVGYWRTHESILGMDGVDPNIIHDWQIELASSAIVGAATAVPLIIVLGILFAIRAKQIRDQGTDKP